MSKFKVGDIVKIREDLDKFYKFGDINKFDIVDDMLKYSGKEATVTGVNNRLHLDIDNGKWSWQYDLVNPVEGNESSEVISNDKTTLNLVIENITSGVVINYQNIECIEYDNLSNILNFEYYNDTIDGLVTVSIHIDKNIRFFTTKGE